MNLRASLSEFLGTAVLAMVVVGSGIMGTQLTADLALVLLINAISTVLALGLLIFLFGPISGAHFNPAVSLVELIQRRISLRIFGAYVIAQIAGGIIGVVGAHTMYGLPAVSMSQHQRSSAGFFLGELVATAGLILLIGVLGQRGLSHLSAVAISSWIGSAYFFTSSTSFANPALTLARSFTDSFAGIASSSVGLFIAAQCVGALAGLGLLKILWPIAASASH